MVQKCIVEPATGCRNDNRLRQFVSDPHQKWNHTRYRTCFHVMDSNDAYQEHRTGLQQYMAGEETEKFLQDCDRLYGNVYPCPYYHCRHIRYINIRSYGDKPDRGHGIVCPDGEDIVGYHALRFDVSHFHSPLCIHAKHKGKTEMRHLAGSFGRRCHAGTTAILYPFADLGKQL